MSGGPAGDGLEALAAKLQRPVRSLVALSALEPGQVAALGRWVDEALVRENAAVETAFRDVVPWPIRWLVRRVLRV